MEAVYIYFNPQIVELIAHAVAWAYYARSKAAKADLRTASEKLKMKSLNFTYHVTIKRAIPLVAWVCSR